MAFSHFNNIFNLDSPDPVCLQELWSFPIPELTSSDQDNLQKPITIEEITQAVFSLPKDSAPGCDGFHASFF